MYPRWYEKEMDQAERDYSNGLLSYEQFNKEVSEIDQQLYEQDAGPLGVDPYIGY